jgi:hypothetical protein
MDATAAALLLCRTHDKLFRIRKYLFVLLNGHAQPERMVRHFLYAASIASPSAPADDAHSFAITPPIFARPA